MAEVQQMYEGVACLREHWQQVYEGVPTSHHALMGVAKHM